MQIAKKDSGMISVTYKEALDIALCYGWIDSQKVNKEKAELLIAKGRMRPSGFKAIETAKQNLQWDKAYESQRNASIPEDLAIELERNIKAQTFYDSLDSQNKYAILFRIHQAKKQETRMTRIQQFVAMLEKGETLYPKK